MCNNTNIIRALEEKWRKLCCAAQFSEWKYIGGMILAISDAVLYCLVHILYVCAKGLLRPWTRWVVTTIWHNRSAAIYIFTPMIFGKQRSIKEYGRTSVTVGFRFLVCLCLYENSPINIGINAFHKSRHRGYVIHSIEPNHACMPSWVYRLSCCFAILGTSWNKDQIQTRDRHSTPYIFHYIV